MNRHEYAALARGTICVALGALPFLAIGWFGSWWIAGGLVAAGVAGAAWWLSRLPVGARPW